MAQYNLSLSLSRMVASALRYWWRVSLSVAFGVAVATAVIVGALLVGDSMRGSLRQLTIERLGNTEVVIFPGGFFSAENITSDAIDPIALILFDSAVVETRRDDGTIRRAGSVQVVGSDVNFWDLDVSGVRPEQLPSGDEVVLNSSAAKELGVEVGDLVTVRLPVEQAVPADSPLGRRDIQTEGLPRMKVVDIVPDRGLGRFSLAANQAAPKNVYLDRKLIGEVLDRDNQANTLLVAQTISQENLRVDLDDLGLNVDQIRREYTREDGTKETIYDYFWVTSDRLLVPELVAQKIVDAFPGSEVSVTSTYLANAIEKLDESGNVVASIPYSTITAMDSSESFPLDFRQPISDEETPNIPFVLNSWAAERLGAKVGTPLRVAYYEPEVENGKEIERFFDVIVTSIVPITKPATPYRRRREATFDSPPTIYNDPDLTPTVPGVTDQDSISDWDLPFKLDREISKEDDEYWNEYRLTPKAFLPLEDGQELFGSRFGKTTGVRLSSRIATDEKELKSVLRDLLADDLAELGWVIRPLKQQQLSASKGTTPFDGLFLALSFFVILAAVILIAMLFRLGLTERMQQYGTLLAVGWPPRRVASLALREGLAIATFGALIGLGGGWLYAKIVLWALRSWWVGAVTVPFLTFHWQTQSLVIGTVSGWFVAALTLMITTRWLTRENAQTLLSRRDLDTGIPGQKPKTRLKWVAALLGIVAIGLAALGAATGGQTAAGAFVGSGMMLLSAALIMIFIRLRQPRRIAKNQQVGGYSIGSLAARNASRNPLRSTLTIGLMATAAFLIIAITAFRLEPTESGTGGFDLVGQSAQPIYRDLSQPDVQSDLFGPDAKQLAQTRIASFRVKAGQDASCNNLYRATRPTVLGVPEFFGQTFATPNGLPGFDWAATTETADTMSPWDALNQPASGTEEDPIPVVIDQNTAMWSLQMTGGIGEKQTFEYEEGKPITFQVVGLLSNSLLQGKLLIGNHNFEQLFENISGYQFFLIACEADRSETVATILENRLGDAGMDLSNAYTVLSSMLAVQNTYLRTFQSLGALGLLLGTIGLAVAQLRGVLERRQELAVMQAIGFTRKRLATVVLAENASLLLTGIGCGIACAILAVLPHAIIGGLAPPIIEPLFIVAGIILFGMLAGLIAVRRVTRMPLLESLRAD